MSDKPAEVISRAAALMRDRATLATEEHGHWGYSDDFTGTLSTGALKAHIVSWHPGMALGVADWLDSLSGIDWSEHHSYSDELMYALRIARAYLAGES
jgi:hypothetical protein